MEEVLTAGEGPEPGRRGLRLLGDRQFGPYLLGKLVSLTGLWGHNLLCAVLIYEETGSVAFVGLVSLAQFGPQVVLAGWSGALADRHDRLAQLVVGRLLSVSASGALGLWYLLGLDGPGTTVAILASSLLMGAGLVVGGPAMMALVPALVRPHEVAAAVQLDSVPMLLGRALGPAIGAVMLVGSSVPTAFFTAAAGNAIFVVVLLAIRHGVARRAVADSGDHSMWGGLAYVRRAPRLALLLAAVAAAAVGADPSITLAPALAELDGGGRGAAGLFTSSFGVGAAVGAVGAGVLARSMGAPRTVTVGLAVMATSTAALALPMGTKGAVVAFALAGVGMSQAFIGSTTLLQVAVPDQLRGRVMSLWLICFVGVRPIAALTNGALADMFSVHAALVSVGALLALTAMACSPSRLTFVPEDSE